MSTESFTFNQQDVVDAYTHQSHLQKPEETILSLLSKELPEMSMLDLGVGAGRTTLHFAKWVKQYQGIDISENMTKVCEKRFANYPLDLSFKVADAAKLDWIENSSVDLVLFSFNGIDYVNHEHRLSILDEVKRVLKPGGYFVFSTHNILSVDDLFLFKNQVARNPVAFIRSAIKWLKLNWIHNKNIKINELKSMPYAIINDGSYQYSLDTYYVAPKEQVKQLENDFNNIRAFSLGSGEEITDTFLENKESWIYFLCQKNAES